ncbi:diguanylate cyclase [Desulfofundulus kuznetsovii DSM 6115]|uniref:Diguanylate cyclase n=1 Tax=Desulfofundulus kuznetsovii (strain DSM 6115 / VKM B-1805 / 17) TaxID=760568 RepID=A0AAU8PKL3_DESK7|nr:diguanylate cyclase [Desulfofundulus kuznetsovii DSM 6115]
MGMSNLLQLTGEKTFDPTNLKIGKWRIITVFLSGLGYFLFCSRQVEWVFFWIAWFIYAALWFPFQGRHAGENPNWWTYFFMVGDVLFFVLAANIEHDILNNYSAMLILPLFQYLLRYGRKAALCYVWVSVAAFGYICLFHYEAHPARHFVVVVVMLLISYNESMLIQENRELRKQLFNLAIYDELTGLYNFRFFTQVLEKELGRSKEYGYEVTLLMIDIDNFKTINDVYGHEKGNEVLRCLGKIILDCVRENDYAARYGGEEFVIILPKTSLNEGHLIAERLKKRISKHPFDFGNVTVSIGVSTYPAPSTSKDRLIKHADRAMYLAKANGKNRVKVYSELSR